MVITDAMIQQTMIKNGIGYVIAGVVFLAAGLAFGFFFEKERRKVQDVRDRKARLVVHLVTGTLVLAGVWFTVMLGGRWLLFSDSYQVYETTVADKSERRIKNAGKNAHIHYYVYFDGTSAVQVIKPFQKEEFDAIQIGDRALVIDGVNNSYLKVYYDDGYAYEGEHLVKQE